MIFLSSLSFFTFFYYLFCFMQYIHISHINFFLLRYLYTFLFFSPVESLLLHIQLTVLLLSIEDLEIQVYTKDFSIFTGLSLWFCLFQRF